MHCYSSDEAPICYNVATSEKEVGHRNHALQQLEQGAEGLSKEETMALRSLLNSYVDVYALVDDEFGKTSKIMHRIILKGQNLLSTGKGDGHSTKRRVICLREV